MKKVLVLMVILFGLISCDPSNNRKEQRRSLLVAACHLSSTNNHEILIRFHW